MGYQSFKELRVWQEAKDSALKIYNFKRLILIDRNEHCGGLQKAG